MSDATPEVSNRSVARTTQDKFEWYFLALIFTLLSLSVQTAKLGGSFGADIFEVLGWISLLISGVAGLSRIEAIPKQYLAFEAQETISQQRRDVQRAAMADNKVFDISIGKDRPIAEVLKEVDEKAAAINKRSDEIARTLNIRYRMERFGFLLGAAFLVVARGYPVFERTARALA